MAIALKTVRMVPKPQAGYQIKPQILKGLSMLRHVLENQSAGRGALSQQQVEEGCAAFLEGIVGVPLTLGDLEVLGIVERCQSGGMLGDSIEFVGTVSIGRIGTVTSLANRMPATAIHEKGGAQDGTLKTELFLRRLLVAESFEPLER